LTLASVLLYPKTLGGGAVFSGWVPFNSSITEQITPEAKQVLVLRNKVILRAISISFFSFFL
jgi:lysophospholipase-2